MASLLIATNGRFVAVVLGKRGKRPVVVFRLNAGMAVNQAKRCTVTGSFTAAWTPDNGRVDGAR